MSKPIEDVLDAHTGEWLSVPGVVGTAIGLFEGRPCLTVHVVRHTDELAARFPATQDGYRVVLRETGEIRLLSQDTDPAAGPEQKGVF